MKTIIAISKKNNFHQILAKFKFKFHQLKIPQLQIDFLQVQRINFLVVKRLLCIVLKFIL